MGSALAAILAGCTASSTGSPSPPPSEASVAATGSLSVAPTATASPRPETGCFELGSGDLSDGTLHLELSGAVEATWDLDLVPVVSRPDLLVFGDINCSQHHAAVFRDGDNWGFSKNQVLEIAWSPGDATGECRINVTEAAAISGTIECSGLQAVRRPTALEYEAVPGEVTVVGTFQAE